MRNSCGAIFYTYDPAGQLGIVLGLEQHNWLPFKGCSEEGETVEETAIREVYEETCGLVQLDNISLEHRFASKRKNYFIGLCHVPYDLIRQFSETRKSESRLSYMEKKRIKFFPYSSLLTDKTIHNISRSCIRYFWNKLTKLSRNCNTVLTPNVIKQSCSVGFIKSKCRVLDNANEFDCEQVVLVGEPTVW